MAKVKNSGQMPPPKSMASIWSLLSVAAGWTGAILLSPIYLVGGPAFLYGRFITRPLLILSTTLGARIAGALSAMMGGGADGAKLLLMQVGSIALPAIGFLSIAPPVFALDSVFGQDGALSSFSAEYVPEWLFLLIGFAALIAFIIGVVGMGNEQHAAFDIEKRSDLEDAHQAVFALLYKRSGARRSPVEHRYQGVAALLREQGFRFVRRTRTQEDVWVTQNADRMLYVPLSTSGAFTLASSLAFCALAATLTFIAISCTYFLSGGYLENGGAILLIGAVLGVGFSACGKYAKEFGEWLSQFRIKLERVRGD